MKAPEEYINNWILTAEPYSDRHMDIAWEHPEVLRMMSNENLVCPSPAVLDAVMEAARMGNLYPGSGPLLRAKLGERSGLSAENVILGSGSTDVINFVIHTFCGPGDEVLISVPSFPMYESRTRVSGAAPVQVPMTRDFYWDIPALLAAITPRTKLIFICSPNNPTGNVIDPGDLRRLLEPGIPLFYDEAYYELMDQVETRAGWIKECPHMLVNRTFSKAFGLAGCRIGYLLCDARLAPYFNRVRFPWNVSLLGIAAALAELDSPEDLEAKRQTIIAGRAYLYEEINRLPGMKAYPSQGNFILVDAHALGKTSEEIRTAMAAKGIYIRPMSGHHMEKGFIRITVGEPGQNQRFMELFKEYMAEAAGSAVP